MPTIIDFNNQLLGDLGIQSSLGQGYMNDMNFLRQWETAETGGNLPDRATFNPLATTQTAPGSYAINSAGVQAFPTLQEGAQTTADVFHQNFPGYSTILQSLIQGDPGSQDAQGVNTWGTTSFAQTLAAGGQVNVPGLLSNSLATAGGQQAQQNLFNQAGQAGVLAGQNEQYAQTETGFQAQLNNLNKMQLGGQEQALLRQYALAPKEYQFQLQNIGRQQEGAYGQEAGSGSFFTKGAGDTREGLHQERLQAQLSYNEQLASIRDQNNNLKLQAARYGISDQELQARLQNTLQNIAGGYIQDVYALTGQDIAQQQALASTLQGAPASAPYGLPSSTQNPYGFPTSLYP